MKPALVMRGALTAAVGWAFGCTPDAVVLTIELDPEIKSVILAIENLAIDELESGKITRVAAFERKTDTELWRDSEYGDQPLRITVLAYRATLVDLFLAEGEMPRDLGTSPKSVGLPEPVNQILVQVLPTDEEPRWETDKETIADASADLAAFRTAKTNVGCTEFESQPFSLPNNLFARFMVPLDERSVLVGVGELDIYNNVGLAQYFIFDENGLEAVSSSASVSSTAYYSAARSRTGELWFGGLQGKLYRDGKVHRDPLRIEASYVASVETASPAAIFHLDLVEDGEVTVYALDAGGLLSRLRGGQLEVLWDLRFPDTPMQRRDAFSLNSVAGLSASEALATCRDELRVVNFRAGTISSEVYPSGSNPMVVSHLRPTESLPARVLLGTSLGDIFERDANDSSWRAVGDTEFTLDIRSFVRWKDGFLYGGHREWIGEYQPGRGFCPPKQLAFFASAFVVPMGNLVFVAGETEDGRENNQVTLLRAR